MVQMWFRCGPQKMDPWDAQSGASDPEKRVLQSAFDGVAVSIIHRHASYLRHTHHVPLPRRRQLGEQRGPWTHHPAAVVVATVTAVAAPGQTWELRVSRIRRLRTPATARCTADELSLVVPARLNHCGVAKSVAFVAATHLALQAHHGQTGRSNSDLGLRTSMRLAEDVAASGCVACPKLSLPASNSQLTKCRRKCCDSEIQHR